MKKTKDITKYDIHWQVRRVSFKLLKNYKEKVDSAIDYFNNNLNRADRERILNYLEGLSMAYKNEDRKYILDVRDRLALIEVSTESRCSLDFSCYNSKELTRTAKDNMVRCTAYLKKGYRHKELIHFMKSIYEYLNDSKGLEKLNDLEVASYNIENSVHFFF